MTSDTVEIHAFRRRAVRSWLTLLAVIAVALLLVGCGADARQEAGAPGTGIVLDSGGSSGSGGGITLPKIFTHDEHFSHFASVDCALCHQSVHSVGGSSFLPAPEVCLNCHAGDMDEWAHRYHLGLQQGIVCLDCHGAGAAAAAAVSSVCLACHSRISP